MEDKIAYRISNGDVQAFELVFRRLYFRLCCYTNKFLNDPEETKEVVQDVFAELWIARANLKPEYPVDCYLYKIARNLSISRLRKKKTVSDYLGIIKIVYLDHEEDNPVYEMLYVTELENKFASALERLPRCCRRVFELSRNEGMKYSEIAKLLNISIKTVEAQMSKALKILRVELSEFITTLLLLLIV